MDGQEFVERCQKHRTWYELDMGCPQCAEDLEWKERVERDVYGELTEGLSWCNKHQRLYEGVCEDCAFEWRDHRDRKLTNELDEPLFDDHEEEAS